MKLTRYLVYSALGLLVGFVGGFLVRDRLRNESTQLFSRISRPVEKPLEVYTIENLSNYNFRPGKLKINELLEKEDAYTTYLFEFTFDPDLNGDGFKVTTGVINIPNHVNANELEYPPIILMLRGYVDPTIYKSGVGTRNAARYFAENGFITIAPDFLGYAGSDENAADIFESRFQTYTTAVSLLKSLEALQGDSNFLSFSDTLISEYQLFVNKLAKNVPIYIWAHSNGGQIALVTLEVTKGVYPTTLWAPVTKGFPYSVLYYTDESEDKGKFIRRALAQFEKLYDADSFSVENYLQNIKAPIMIQQGTADDSVPKQWSDGFVKRVKSLGVDTIYNVYEGADHNLRPAWDQVVETDLDFFTQHMEGVAKTN